MEVYILNNKAINKKINIFEFAISIDENHID